MGRSKMLVISLAILSIICSINAGSWNDGSQAIVDGNGYYSAGTFRHQHSRRSASTTKSHPVNVEWLTQPQLAELESEGMDTVSQVEKIRLFYDALPAGSVERKAAAKKIVGQCYSWLPKVSTQQERDELDSLHHSDHNECKRKMGEMIARLPESEQTKLREYWNFCEHVWYESAHNHHSGDQHGDHHGHHVHGQDHPVQNVRMRREEAATGGHTLEDYFKTHLSWLTDEQKDELRGMKTEGKSRTEIQQKVISFFEAATGETKTKATEQLQAGCRQLLKSVVGDEKAAQLKTLKESGASPTELHNKVEELLADVTDAEKKAIAQEYGAGCRKVFGVGVQAAGLRRRRDHHGDHAESKLEDYFKTHLSWLTDAQKDELRGMKTDGKSKAEIQEKVMSYYDATTGETKTKATEQLQAGCRELLQSVVGEDNAAELKRMRESGATPETLQAKVKELVDALPDENKKAKAKEYGPSCGKIFNVPTSSRRRREGAVPGGHTLEDYFKTHLSWLTDEQKEELRGLKTEGKSRSEIQQKVLTYFDAATDETKTKATEQLKAGCRQLLKSVVGEEKATELKTLKESGASETELKAKVEALMAEVTDLEKKAIAQEFGAGCRKVFGVSSRRRREGEGAAPPAGHTLEDYFKTHLSWLTDAQKEELRGMKTEGKSKAEIQEKVISYFESATGETKTKATEQLQGGCRQLVKSVLGEEKANELKTLRESGATPAELSAKVETMLAEVTDPAKKTIAQEYGAGCRKVFGVGEKAGARRRRERHGLEHKFDNEYKWLTDEQKQELRDKEEEGVDAPAIQNKVLEFFHVSPEDVKSMARNLLSSGCEKLLTRVFGEEKAEEIHALRKSGASTDAVQQKVSEYASEIQDEGQRAEALQYGSTCQKIFQLLVRKRRELNVGEERVEKRNMEGYFQTNLIWLSEEEKEELRGIAEEGGEGRTEIQDRVRSFYAARSPLSQPGIEARRQLRKGCRQLLFTILGPKRVEQLREFKEGGASPDDLESAVRAFLEMMEENGETSVREFGPSCRRLFGI